MTKRDKIIRMIVERVVNRLAEDRQLDNPNVEYHEQVAKGVINKVTTVLHGQTLTGANRVLKEFVELKYAIDELSKKQQSNEEAVREYFPQFFDAADRAYTNVIDLGNITLSLAKASLQGRSTVDYSSVITGILELVPELKDKVEELITQNTKIGNPAKSALTAKFNDEPGEVSRIRGNLKQVGYYDENLNMKEGILDSIRSKFINWFRYITSWFDKFDRKVDRLKRMAKVH